MAGVSEQKISWVPLESNPDLMTEYSKKLGACKGKWIDVIGFGDEELETVPRPVVAVIFLYVSNKEYEMNIKNDDDRIKQNGQVIDPKLFFLKQTINNACGAIGIIHSLANNVDEIELADGPLKALLEKSKTLTPYLRGKALEESKDIESVHSIIATAGQTTAPRSDQEVEPHFIAFVRKGSRLYELDGDRPFPVSHGNTTSDNLLKDVVKICKKRIEVLVKNAGEENSTDEYRFSVIALTTGDLD